MDAVQQKKRGSHVAGSTLVPDLKSDAFKAGVHTAYRYWVGLLPGAPINRIDIAGIDFPQMIAQPVPDPTRPETRILVPAAGALVTLTEAKFRALCEALPRKVLRFYNPKSKEALGSIEEPGAGQNTGAVHIRSQRGHVLTIPTPEMVDARQKRGLSTNTYHRADGDQPLARFLYCVPAEVRGGAFPDPVEVTGMSWPDDLAPTQPKAK